MQYTTIVDKDETGLKQIIASAKKFEEDRFLEGIHQRCYTAQDIQVAIDKVREYQARLNIEAKMPRDWHLSRVSCPFITFLSRISQKFGGYMEMTYLCSQNCEMLEKG